MGYRAYNAALSHFLPLFVWRPFSDCLPFIFPPLFFFFCFFLVYLPIFPKAMLRFSSKCSLVLLAVMPRWAFAEFECKVSTYRYKDYYFLRDPSGCREEEVNRVFEISTFNGLDKCFAGFGNAVSDVDARCVECRLSRAPWWSLRCPLHRQTSVQHTADIFDKLIMLGVWCSLQLAASLAARDPRRRSTATLTTLAHQPSVVIS